MIDFTKLQVLIGPRHKSKRAERGDREKLARLHMKRAKGPKNHATNKERSHVARAKANKMAREDAARNKRKRSFIAALRAYYRGEGDYPLVDRDFYKERS